MMDGDRRNKYPLLLFNQLLMSVALPASMLRSDSVPADMTALSCDVGLVEPEVRRREPAPPTEIS